ncbi:MAG: alpha/beta hydrolase [Holophagales bacterium]|nr:alpha/beta hydrolase [Holophagales bacterium]
MNRSTRATAAFLALLLPLLFAPAVHPESTGSPTPFDVQVGEITLHGARMGTGEPVVLLHGWPQTHLEWRHVMPLLAENHDVVAFDLRGTGGSSKPRGGYDPKTLAADIDGATHALGVEEFHLVGHDIGGMVAFAFAHEHGERLLSLTILDVPFPGTPIFEAISRDPRAWHFGFHQVPDLPERLVRGRERAYIEHFVRSLAVETERALAEIDAYVRNLSDADALRAGFEYYRAFPQAAEQNATYLERQLQMPILALSGGVPWTYDMMRPLGHHVVGGAIENSGHWIAEEQPEALARRLRAFFAEESAAANHGIGIGK